MAGKLKILFLCTGNACRSQMAEGWAKHLKGDAIEAYSAGVDPKGLNQRAVQVMNETRVDISHHRSKHVDEVLQVPFDYVVTVCDNAREACPTFPGNIKMIHRKFDDPPFLVKETDTEEQALDHYRRVRDEIKSFIEALPETLNDQ